MEISPDSSKLLVGGNFITGAFNAVWKLLDFDSLATLQCVADTGADQLTAL